MARNPLNLSDVRPLTEKGPREDAVTTDQVAEAKKQQTAISRAFEGACEELGVGLSSLDVWRREQLAQLILQLVSEGELESTTLQMNAVSRFKNADADENDEGAPNSSGSSAEGH